MHYKCNLQHILLSQNGLSAGHCEQDGPDTYGCWPIKLPLYKGRFRKHYIRIDRVY